MKTKNIERRKVKKNSKITSKSYIRDCLIFVDKNLIKCIGILFVVAILLIAISVKPIITSVLAKACEGTCSDEVSLFSRYAYRLSEMFIIVLAGMVPYMYVPVIGFLVYTLNEVSSFAYAIKGYGYLLGIGIGIIPLILNIIIICVITALGIYVCRTVTVGYKISNMKNMNFTNFKIEIYKLLQKEQKLQTLTKSRDEKMAKLEAKKNKINYLQILNVSIVMCVLQFIATLIQQIIL